MAQKRCYGCMNLKTSSPVCEHCGYNEYAQNESHQLPCGTVLQGQYMVGKVLGQGGFGITYLGWDQYLNTPVAIKEFYPGGFVSRDCTHSLAVTSYETETNEALLSTRTRFIREAQTLARLAKVEEVVHVRNFFEANNTAYIIMEYVRGIDLRRYINMRGGRLSAQETLSIMEPILRALIQVHGAGVVHRDISPDNIMMQPGGGAKLLDFGAVRNVELTDPNGDLPRSTEAILKHGFAPIEQYQRRGAMGPWTDEYALCATMYYCMTGRIPADAPERMMENIGINWAAIPGLTAEQMAALDKGMAIRARDRFASVQELYNALYTQYGAWTAYQPQYPQGYYQPQTVPQPAPQPGPQPQTIPQSAPQPVPQPAPQPGPQPQTIPQSAPQPVPQSAPQPAPKPRPAPRPAPAPQPEPVAAYKPEVTAPRKKKNNLLIPVAAAALAVVVLFGALAKGGGKKEEEASPGISLPGTSTQAPKQERERKQDLTYTYPDGSGYETKVDAEGFEIERRLWDVSGHQIRRYTAEYDNNGYMVLQLTFDENDREVFREEWDRNSQGDTLEYRQYEDGSLSTKHVNEFDSKGNVSKATWYNGSGKQYSQIVYDREYDAFGNQTASTAEYDDGTTVKQRYDSDGNIVRYENYENGKLTFASDRIFDANGNMTQFTNYNSKGNVTNVVNRRFDSGNRMTQEEYCAPDGTPQSIYEYTYDANGSQVGHTYRSHTYTSSTSYQQMCAIDGTTVRQTWESSGGYGGMSWFNYSGGQERSESYDANGNRYSYSEYHYDENGDSLGHTYYYESSYDGTTTVTVYDEDYRITDEKSYDASGKLCGWGDNFYDDDGNLVEEVDYRADGSIEYRREVVFDDAGMQIESTYTSYDSNGKISYSSTDRYENDQLIGGRSTYYRDGVMHSYTEHEYENGRLYKATDYDANGKVEGWEIREYDENGNNHKTTYYDAYGNLDRWLEDEFDENGNRVKSTCYNPDGSVSYWSETFYDDNGNYLDTEYHWN